MNKLLLLNISIILNLFSPFAVAETQLYITTGFTPPVTIFYQRVLKEADRRMPEISIVFEELPAERSLVLADQGVNDGECCRIPAIIIKQYKNLQSVDESFFKARFSAFSKKNAAPIHSFEELKPYSVGSVKGWKLVVNKITAVQAAETHIVTTPEQMFQMIEQNRLHYGVLGYLSGLKSISQLKLDNLHAIEPPLIEKDLYLMLHKKHKQYIPVFNKVFKEMKTDGTIDRIYDELMKSF